YAATLRLEYDVVVAADAHPGAMDPKIDGADALELDATGDRLLRGHARTTVQRAAVVGEERHARCGLMRASDLIRGPTHVAFVSDRRHRPFLLASLVLDSTRSLGESRLC